MLELQIEHCPRNDIEPLSELLETTLPLAVTLMDKKDDPILEPEPGTTPLWPHVVIHALYSKYHEAKQAMEMLLTQYPKLNYSIKPVVDQNWEHACRLNFKPQQFGQRLWICPSWLNIPHLNAVNLILDPGLAFGTGTHPTTSLCLTWLEQAHLKSTHLIDYGCGSGILALAAIKLGATHVYAVDIDKQALIATQNNATNNGITKEQLTIGLPDSLNTPVDVLIANILLKPLIDLQSQFRHFIKPQGILAVSGLLESQAEELKKAYKTHFIYKNSSTQDGWSLIEFTRKA